MSAIVGIGIDAVDIGRFRALLERRPTMVERLFSAAERAAVSERADPVPSLAARFAAKEAVMKSLGVGLGAFGFHECEVLRLPSGAPVLRSSGQLARLGAQHDVGHFHLSLTHTDDLAQAIVVAERTAP